MSEIEMLKSWCARARAVEKEHFRACVQFRRMHYLWGGLMISLSALASALTGIAENGNDGEWLTEGIWKFFRFIRPQQGLHIQLQRLITRAGDVEEGGALFGLALQSGFDHAQREEGKMARNITPF